MGKSPSPFLLKFLIWLYYANVCSGWFLKATNAEIPNVKQVLSQPKTTELTRDSGLVKDFINSFSKFHSTETAPLYDPSINAYRTERTSTTSRPDNSFSTPVLPHKFDKSFVMSDAPLKSTSSTSSNTVKNIDLRGKVALVAGVADANGFGWAIAKALNHAGATVLLAAWAPMATRFEKMLTSGALDKDRLIIGDDKNGETKIEIRKVYPLDVSFDDKNDLTDSIRKNPRYAPFVSAGKGFSIAEVAAQIYNEFGKIDFLVHSIANGPEVSKPLMQTSRQGYLSSVSASAYSFVSMVQKFAPMMNSGGSILALSYIASERVIPGYGGGMSSSKAALESDTRTLSYEVGRAYNIRINAISAGPLKSRAASAIKQSGSDKSFIDLAIAYSKANAPLQRDLFADDVADSALFLLSPLSRAVTGTTMYVDNGLHAVGMAQDSASLQLD